MAHGNSDARMIVRRAGLCCDLVGQKPALSPLDTLSVEHLADAVIKEKVSSLLLRRLREHRPELIDALYRQPSFAESRVRIETLVQHKAHVLDLIDREARDLAIEVGAVKGLAAQRHYPDPAVRDLGDLDLMVTDVDVAIRLTARLIAAGYDFHRLEWPWVKRSVESGHIYGQFSLKHSIHPAIDLHFGGYSVRHCALHPLEIDDAKPGLFYYCTQRNLPLIVANAAGDHDVTTKDLNDLAIAIKDSAVDWPRVLQELDGVGLLGFFKCVMEQLAATPLRAIYRDSLLPGLLSGVRREVPAPYPSYARQRRWAVTVLHAFAVGARHSYGRAGITTATAARYYWGNRVTKMRRGGSGPRLPRLNNWTCVRLIPAAMLQTLEGDGGGTARESRFLPFSGPQDRLSGELNRVRTPNGDIIRTALGDFLPAVYRLEISRTL
jgi:hypothetical protein